VVVVKSHPVPPFVHSLIYLHSGLLGSTYVIQLIGKFNSIYAGARGAMTVLHYPLLSINSLNQTKTAVFNLPFQQHVWLFFPNNDVFDKFLYLFLPYNKHWSCFSPDYLHHKLQANKQKCFSNYTPSDNGISIWKKLNICI